MHCDDKPKSSDDEEPNKGDENLEDPVCVAVDLRLEDIEEDDVDERAGGQRLEDGGHQGADEPDVLSPAVTRGMVRVHDDSVMVDVKEEHDEHSDRNTDRDHYTKQ